MKSIKEEIVEVVSLNCDSLRSLTEENHKQTIAAILTTQEGISRTMKGPSCVTDGLGNATTKDIKTATTHSYRQAIDSNSQYDRQAAHFETNNMIDFTKRILNALHFRTIHERRAGIAKAHLRTFEWIYSDPASHANWNGLSQWLKRGKGCYWINGKAGSRKSTLLRFIQEDIRTKEALYKWSESSNPVMASFYFWYAVTPLQKSQMGLLRSLLLKVLTRRPDLIAVLFPNLCRSILSQQLSGSIDFSFQELKSAFMTLVKLTQEGLKVYFIIDGIDEYEGDHTELLELFSQVVDSETVKILLSSRPIPACVRAFSNFPKLRLQDLTHPDVMIYVEDKLGQDLLMQKLDIAESGAAAELVHGITSKASGVFLWVILVVRRLLSGLRDYDTLSDLVQKLEELPPDLETLYELMLGKMSRRNRQ